jgi:hypothetical protein
MSPRRMAVAAATAAVAVGEMFAGGQGAAHAAGPNVLLVGTYNGIAGGYTSIQAAVNAAAPGDWILVAPGDYREQGVASAPQRAGVLIRTPNLHLRGMDRNTTIVDGTRPGAPGTCDAAPSSQQFGPSDGSGGTLGRNGIEIYKADGVSVENLLVCNFLSGSGGGDGNEVWWNGGDGSGHIGLGPLHGGYLTASSSYNYGTDPANHGSSSVPMGKYGIFTSNEGGPGTIEHTYSSNMGDSAYYIGACHDCNLTLSYGHAENSALGFSGTNAGGRLVLQNSEWDQNKAGLAPNTLNNDDWPSPANGACPSDPTKSCSIIRNNYVHDNNNQNAPSFGIAGAAPPGTGILMSGIRNFTVTGNRIVNNNSWGLVINDFPDTSQPPSFVTTPCAGGTDLSTPAQPLCYYNAFGNEVKNNTFTNNGSYANPGNADIAVAAVVHNPGNCIHDNTDTSGTLSSDPPMVQTLMGTCGLPNGNVGPSFLQLVCTTPGAVSIGPITPACNNVPVVANYPQPTGVVILPIPLDQPSMEEPCEDVPANPWCPAAGGPAEPHHGSEAGHGEPGTAGVRPEWRALRSM